MTLADYLTELSQTYQPWELLLKSNENSFTVTDFLENLRPEERERSVGIETGGEGDFVRDAQLVSGCYRLFGPLLGGA